MLDMRREPHCIDRRDKPATMIRPDRDQPTHGAEQLTTGVAVSLRAPDLSLLAPTDQDYRFCRRSETKRIDKEIVHGLKAVLNGLDTLARQGQAS